MSTMELNAELFRQLSIIADDEMLMKKAVKAIRNLAKERLANAVSTNKECENPMPHTMEEIDQWIDEGETEEGGTPSSEVFASMEKKYPWLCK